MSPSSPLTCRPRLRVTRIKKRELVGVVDISPWWPELREAVLGDMTRLAEEAFRRRGFVEVADLIRGGYRRNVALALHKIVAGRLRERLAAEAEQTASLAAGERSAA
jgi:hypothetical protein